MSDYDNLQASFNKIKLTNYKGIPIYTFEGLHETCFSLLDKYNIKKDSKILILGSGAGAFDQRLFDHGFKNITSVDIFKNNYLASCKEDIIFIEKDLNKDFSCDIENKFDLIIAIEVIEHLESSANFIRNISTLLSDSGSVLLTTPNVENSFSRIRFFITGNLQCFAKDDLCQNGHINPIFSFILEFFFDKNKLLVVEKVFSRNIWSSELNAASFIKKIYLVLFYFISRFIKNKNDSEANIYYLKSCK